jgi:predicted AAA+ superfamily ATPase
MNRRVAMQIIYKPRQSGKTTKLIEIASCEVFHIVCRNKREAERVFLVAKKLGFDIPFPLTFHEFINGLFLGVTIKGFVIDDVDLLVKYIARGVPVKAISINKEE